MTVQPNAFSVSVAGTQRAVTRSGDAETSHSQDVSRQARAEKPGSQNTDVEQIERDAATGDSGADGRQFLTGRDPQGESEQACEESHDAHRHRVSKEGTGGRLDFDA